MSIRELKKDDLGSVADLFNQQGNDPFVYLADIQLFKLFHQLACFKGFVAEADRRVIGSIYGLHYLYDYGWIGGLLVHKDLRKMGIDRKLLEAALGFLGPRNAFLFVEPRNVVAKRLFESLGFRPAYRRLNYIVETPLARFRSIDNRVTYDVEWSDVNEAIGFREMRSRQHRLLSY